MSTVQHGHAPDSQSRQPREQFHPTFNGVAHAGSASETTWPDGPVRVLLVNGAPRSDGSWAGEAGRTWRLTELARATLHADGVVTEVLDLGLLSPDEEDWADAVRATWLAAHGIIVLAPAHGDALGAMRAVLAQPGTRDLLADRVYGIVVHGDMGAICHARSALADWLDGLGLVDSDSFGPLTRFVGYYDPDRDGMDGMGGADAGAEPVDEEEVQNVARAVHKAVTELRAGRVTG